MIQLLLVTFNEREPNSKFKEILIGYTKTGQNQSAKYLRDLLANKMPILKYGQQDSFDFFQALHNFAPLEKESLVHQLYIYSNIVMTCKFNSTHETSICQQEPEIYISINIPQSESPLQYNIENEFQEGTLVNDWQCSKCQKFGGFRKKIIRESMVPSYILVQLRRTERDVNGKTFKIHKEVDPPSGFKIKTDASKIHDFSLCGILTHLGQEITAGHYISEVRKNENWWRCNDISIKKTNFEHLSKQGYGFLFKRVH
jgi:ubiquitin C-terminal hydrolase